MLSRDVLFRAVRSSLAVALAVMVVLAGCTGTLVEFRSGPATVPAAALAPVGYVHGNTTELPLSYPLGVGPVERDVTVYVWLSGYSRTVTGPEGTNDTAVFLVVSSPNREVGGQSVNPFAHLSDRALVGRLFAVAADAGAAAGASDALGANVTAVADAAALRETGARPVTVLGTETEMVTYAATVRAGAASAAPTPAADTTDAPDARGASDAAGDRSLVVHLVAVEHDDDVVLAVGVHDDRMDEAAAMASLMAAIEHEAAPAEGAA
jgi:hypothetical protein